MSSISSMRREISKCEAEIKSNNEEIRKLEQRNCELREIKRNFNKTGEKLYDYQRRKNNTYEELRYNLRNTKFAAQCADDMLDYINGNYYKKAGDGIASSIKKLRILLEKMKKELKN